MIRYTDDISAEEYMDLRRKVGWCEFPLKEAQAGLDNAYMIRKDCSACDQRVRGKTHCQESGINMILGLHHISLKCGTTEEFEKTKSFYIEVLGFKLVREWPEGCMIDFGNGKLEIFSSGSGIKTKGALRHMAFATDDVDGLVRKVKEAGYEVFIEPNNIVIGSVPEYPARMAFCFGPLGEEIEFFQEL